MPHGGGDTAPVIAGAFRRHRCPSPESPKSGGRCDDDDDDDDEASGGAWGGVEAKPLSLLFRPRELRRLLQPESAPPDVDATAEGGSACSHVSVMLSAEGSTGAGRRSGSPAECGRRPSQAQRQRELAYLLHVLQAAHAETRRWQSRCTELQAELSSTTAQHVEVVAELNAALAQARMTSHQPPQEEVEAEGAEEDEEAEEEVVGEADVFSTSAERTKNDVGGRDVGRGLSARVLLSPPPDAASPSRSAATSPRESRLERLAREATAASESHDAAAALPLRLGLFTATPLVTFPRPSAASLEAARQAVAAAVARGAGKPHAGAAAVARGRGCGCPRRVRGDGEGRAVGAWHLLRRLVPGEDDDDDSGVGGGGLFSAAVGVYDGVQKLAKRWRRAEDAARRHGKRLQGLEAQAAAVPRLEESLRRQTRLNGALHCRAEESEEVARRLRGQLAAARCEVAKLKQRQLAEPQRHGGLAEAGADEEEAAAGRRQVRPAQERSRPARQPSRDAGEANPPRWGFCRGGSRALRNSGVRAPHDTARTRRSEDAVRRERARADAAAAELSRVRQELQRAHSELRQGKHLLACLVREGRSELREHSLIDAAAATSTTVAQRRQTHMACGASVAVDSPEPRPPPMLATPVADVCGGAGEHDTPRRAESASALVSTPRSSPPQEAEESTTPTVVGQRGAQAEWQEDQQPDAATPRGKGRSSRRVELADGEDDDDTVAPWGDWSKSPL
ncbi:uncharacterized protein Tco025E_01753 [Trypanosoma conorhini]|uniref:Uncharacterized protein n=1 Tax=Trypanosoma conorhini TaxID=83891 RepID=A0A3R7PW02_9TRYP|nr:uncharacterized protein Tco025E_01753 [Trypanosoma conorhini]RNF26004.1 hypothetical protein Tco025E_01753 [Trypanosoma conorhini]